MLRRIDSPRGQPIPGPLGGKLISRRLGTESRIFSRRSSLFFVPSFRIPTMSARRSRRARTGNYSSRSPRLLRSEQLESRTVLTAISPLGHLHLLASPLGGNSGVYANATANTPPTVAKAATATLGSNGKTASLTVLGSDAQGASSLVYTWTITSTPAGGSAKFGVNGTNAAQNDTVTFSEAGVYGISVTLVDKSGLSVTSSVKVNVAQILTGINLYSGATKALVTRSEE